MAEKVFRCQIWFPITNLILDTRKVPIEYSVVSRRARILPGSFPNTLNIENLHYNIMGVVFRPKDFGRGYKKIIENAVKDLSPDTKDNVIKLLESWEGINSKKS